MQQYKISNRLLKHFGVKKMGDYWSETCDDRKEFIKEAINEQQMLAVVGERGIGKSTLFEIAKNELSNNTIFVYANDPSKEFMSIGTILTDMVTKLSGETKRGSRAARKLQLARIMGELHIKSNKNICLVIEEAHRINKLIYRALKELREAEYLGVSPLFSVVLIGHPLLKVKLAQVEEAFLRSHILELSESAGWLNYEERIEFLRTVFRGAIKPTVRKRIAISKRQPLDMINYVEQKMQEAYNAGRSVLDDDVVQPSPAEAYYAMKESYPEAISYKVIAEEINETSNTQISKTTVHDVIKQGNSHKKSKVVMKALDKIALSQEKQTYSKASNL